jgi:uncharacterized protein (DUF1330 family)
MPVYVVIESKIKNLEKYQVYISKVPEIISKFGGKYLARGNKVIPLGKKWRPERMIIIEFPEANTVYEWLASAEYKAISKWREEGAETKAVMIGGNVESFMKSGPTRAETAQLRRKSELAKEESGKRFRPAPPDRPAGTG